MRDLERSAADLAAAAAERQKDAIVVVYFDGGRREKLRFKKWATLFLECKLICVGY
jgi:hypothetical protein